MRFREFMWTNHHGEVIKLKVIYHSRQFGVQPCDLCCFKDTCNSVTYFEYKYPTMCLIEDCYYERIDK